MSDAAKLWIGKVETGGALSTDSMAAAIYDELVALVPLTTAEDPLPRQKLAIAIATGVVCHLKAHSAAFHLNVADGGAPIDRPVTIEVGDPC